MKWGHWESKIMAGDMDQLTRLDHPHLDSGTVLGTVRCWDVDIPS